MRQCDHERADMLREAYEAAEKGHTVLVIGLTEQHARYMKNYMKNILLLGHTSSGLGSVFTSLTFKSADPVQVTAWLRGRKATDTKVFVDPAVVEGQGHGVLARELGIWRSMHEKLDDHDPDWITPVLQKRDDGVFLVGEADHDSLWAEESWLVTSVDEPVCGAQDETALCGRVLDHEGPHWRCSPRLIMQEGPWEVELLCADHSLSTTQQS